MEVTQGSEGTGTGGAGAAGGVGDTTTTTVATPAAAAGGTAAGGSAGVGGGKEPPPAGAAALAAPVFVPNFKYKVRKEEREIPEWARSVVTSADAEKQMRELFEKADGLDEIKQHREVLVQENQAMRKDWAPIVQQVQGLQQVLQKKDYHSFFGALNIPEEDILRYALNRVQLREKPELLAVHDQMQLMQQQNLQLQQQLQGLTTESQEAQVGRANLELETGLARPEVAAAVQAFDARVGKPGAFRGEVILRGKAYHAAGQSISVEQAVAETLQRFGWTPPAAAVEQTSGGAGAAATAGGKLPVLPNIKGKGTSPAKTVPRSTDDLRKIARERFHA